MGNQPLEQLDPYAPQPHANGASPQPMLGQESPNNLQVPAGIFRRAYRQAVRNLVLIASKKYFPLAWERGQRYSPFVLVLYLIIARPKPPGQGSPANSAERTELWTRLSGKLWSLTYEHDSRISCLTACTYTYLQPYSMYAHNPDKKSTCMQSKAHPDSTPVKDWEPTLRTNAGLLESIQGKVQ